MVLFTVIQLHACYLFTIILYVAPDPPSITATSVDVTSITLHWDPLLCQHRNGDFSYYIFIYFPTFSPYNFPSNDFVFENSKQHTLTRLPPRTSYEILVRAINTDTSLLGIVADLTVSTSAPSGKSL